MTNFTDLVARLRRGELEEGELDVVADRCDELGFQQAAVALRSPLDCTERRQAIWALSALLGIESTIFNRYDAVLGFEHVAVGGADVETLEATSPVRFRLRRLVLLRPDRDRIHVTGIRVGKRQLLLRSGPVQGSLFSEEGFDMFDAEVEEGSSIAVVIENDGPRDVVLGGCVLGSRYVRGAS